MKNNLVIGAGLSGLLASHYISDSKIIEKTDSIGGQMKSKQEIDAYNYNKVVSKKYTMGLKYLHPSKELLDLYEEFKITPEIYNFKSKVYHDSNYHTFDEYMSDALRRKYFEKTRHQDSNNVDLDVVSVMNSVKTDLVETGITNADTLIYNLKERADIRQPVNIDYIDINNKEILTDAPMTFKYDKLISTVPLPDLGAMLHKDFDLPCTHLYFCSFFLKKNGNLDFDYAYFPENKFRFHRVTIQDEVIIAEISSVETEDYMKEVEEQLMSLGILEENNIKFKTYTYQHYGHFQYSSEVDDTLKEVKEFLNENSIYTAGRYADWDHSEKINNTIDKILKIKSATS